MTSDYFTAWLTSADMKSYRALAAYTLRKGAVPGPST
jgi:hypothetical protein